jgi:FkbM family methyltransferase
MSIVKIPAGQMSERYIRIRGDVVVGVPPRLRCLTTWVLLEQEDWFEKEIAFVRRWLKPGMRAIDIGANFGVYALTMARLVGSSGKVWAFEPARETAAAFGRSIAQNGFRNLHLVEAALANQEGTGELFHHGQSELNSLIHGGGDATLGTETVRVTNLDRQRTELGWDAIDFLKIDAEGCGAQIIAGGSAFLAEQSPLVMFEALDSSAGSDHAEVPAALRAIGYDIYRLVGPDTLLAPVGLHDPLLNSDLNLFACKPDRAMALAAANLLVPRPAANAIFAAGGGQAFYARQAYAPAFGALVARSPLYRDALDAYAAWRDTQAEAGLRLAALNHAFKVAREASAEKISCVRLATLARIALEAGDRQLAIDTLWHLLQLQRSGGKPLDEPFFPPASRYDAIDPRSQASAWFTAATIEAYEVVRFYSSIFMPKEALQLGMLDWLQSTPFASAAMERRRQLQRWLAGLQPGLEAALLKASDGV